MSGGDDKAIGTADTLFGGETPRPAASDPGDATQLPPTIAGRYEVLGWIGAGGMGNVYRARDHELEEVVALKMLRRELVGDAASLARFRQEVKLARRVTHPNVARTFDIGEHGGEKFLTMEYVEGESLSSVVARGALDIGRVIDIGVAVCAGLSAAHDAGVVHRDLKPDNVLVGRAMRVVITDFGIARAHAPGDAGRQTSSFVGTPTYMAPEQVEGKACVDTRADIYALGAMLFELTTGRAAWEGETALAIAAARLLGPPPDPRSIRRDLPPRLANAILRCMARAPEDRFARASDVADELRASGDSGVAPSATSAPVPVSSHDPSTSIHALADVLRTAETAVAVLPLRNGLGAADDYVAEGLTDDLIDTLSMTSGLRVRPRGMVAKYEGERGDPRVIGEELGVQVVVDGSVRRTAESMRLTLRVISVAEGFQLWAGRFDVRAADLLVVIDEAARAIASSLAVKVNAPPRAAPADELAIDLYFRAKQEYRRAWHTSMTVAVDLFEQALTRAPDNPEILAGCAIARARMAFFSDAAPGPAIARARELAERAVVLAPHHGDSWAALASAHMNGGDPLGAVKVLRSGVASTPKSAVLQEMLGRILIEVGAPEQGIARLEAALSLDPTSVAPEFELARAFAIVGAWARVDEILARPLLDVASRNISRARFALWRRAQAPTAPGDTPPSSYQRLWAEVLTARTITEEQRTFMREKTRNASGRLRALFWQRNVEVLAFVHETDAALDAFEGTIDAGLIDIVWADRCPLFDALRVAPRWPALRAKLMERVAPIAAALAVSSP